MDEASASRLIPERWRTGRWPGRLVRPGRTGTRCNPPVATRDAVTATATSARTPSTATAGRAFRRTSQDGEIDLAHGTENAQLLRRIQTSHWGGAHVGTSHGVRTGVRIRRTTRCRAFAVRMRRPMGPCSFSLMIRRSRSGTRVGLATPAHRRGPCPLCSTSDLVRRRAATAGVRCRRPRRTRSRSSRRRGSGPTGRSAGPWRASACRARACVAGARWRV